MLYGCTTWTLIKRMEKKLDGNYTRIQWAILNKSWRQQPKKQQLYGRHPSRKLSKLNKQDMRDTAGEVGMNSRVTYSCGPLHMDEQRLEDQLGPICNSSEAIQDVALKTCRERWTIETDGERGSGRSLLAVRHDYDAAYSSLICITYLLLQILNFKKEVALV